MCTCVCGRYKGWEVITGIAERRKCMYKDPETEQVPMVCESIRMTEGSSRARGNIV